MKKPKDTLFELIKSLDRFEKGHFRRYCTQNSNREKSVYIRLFDQIDKQIKSGIPYNEELIKQRFSNERSVKQFSVIKNYLYNLILKSLRYYNVNSADLQLDELIYDIDFLIRKSQHHECLRIISKAKKIAEENEKFEKLLEIINREKFLIKTAGISRKHKTIDELHEEEVSVHNKLRCVNDYERLSDKIINLAQEIGIVRNDKDTVKFKKIMNNPLLKNEKLAITYTARLNYHFTLTAYYFSISDFMMAFNSVKELIGFLEKNPLKLEKNSYNYISNLQNLLFISTHLEKLNEAELHLNKLKEKFALYKINLHPYTQKALSQRSLHLEISLYNTKKEYNKSIFLIEKLKNEINDNEVSSEIRLPFYFTISVSYFESKKFEQALGWINKVLNDEEIIDFPDVYSSARILNLIIHFELGNSILIEYNVRTLYKYLLMKKSIHGFEKTALKFIRKLPKISDTSDFHDALVSAKKDLIKIKENPYENTMLEYFDFVSWVDAKIMLIESGTRLGFSYMQ